MTMLERRVFVLGGITDDVSVKEQSLQTPEEFIVYDVMGPDPLRSSEQSENSERKLLVLVNGFQRNRLDFRALRKRLHAENPNLVTLALDNRGAGDSVVHEQFTLSDMANDVISLADQVCSELNISCFSLLGISMGGMICQVAAANLQARSQSLLESSLRVSHLILVSTTAGGDLRVWPDDSASLSPMPKDYPSLLERTREYFGSRFKKSSPLLIEAMAKNILKNATGDHDDKRALLQRRASTDFDGAQSLKILNTHSLSVLVVTGTEDQIIPAENSKRLAAALPRAKLIEYPSVGHLVLIEEPELFSRDIRDFIESSQI